ncbi:hypothetical protein SKAU_G00342630 [Synaphobranchus kaupii]|uniref:Uncharacterized protein n=1 Tax=Synaphobranchus kaupii TaxID=118154 RepID=A0A9Q1IGE9_SYNKA|nr:hypothetical protein SKAU_G00342630 [Synaphobranchus kaupii]
MPQFSLPPWLVEHDIICVSVLCYAPGSGTAWEGHNLEETGSSGGVRLHRCVQPIREWLRQAEVPKHTDPYAVRSDRPFHRGSPEVPKVHP